MDKLDKMRKESLLKSAINNWHIDPSFQGGLWFIFLSGAFLSDIFNLGLGEDEDV